MGVDNDDVEGLVLPLSGLRLEWRGDGRSRFVPPAQYADEIAGRFEPGPEDWTRADPPLPCAGRAQRAPGSGRGPSWWLLYGAITGDGPVTVTLADGRTPPMLTLGPLWICEWVSEWQEARVICGGDSHTVFGRKARYLRAQDG